MTAFLLSVAIFVALASISTAQTGDPPTITGDPIVGETLTSSEVGDNALYRWQRCNPAVSTCANAAANDSNWNDITGAHGHDARTYTVALADVGHFIRVLAKSTALGSQWTASAPVGPVPGPVSFGPVEPVPVPTPGVAPGLLPLKGVQVLAEPVGGTVKVKGPGQSAFSILTELSLIEVGSIIDTHGGRVRLVAATGPPGSQTPDQPLDFYAGVFKINQAASAKAFAIAKLIGKPRCRKGGKGGAKSAAADGPLGVSASHRGAKLWGSGSGKYGTKGGRASATVRGTKWLTKETCVGTKFFVKKGKGITVFDFKLKKKIKLGPGEKYLAQG